MALIKQLFTKFFPKTILFQPIKKELGRWGMVGDNIKDLPESHINKQIERITQRANEDHCGDNLCGLPKKIK